MLSKTPVNLEKMKEENLEMEILRIGEFQALLLKRDKEQKKMKEGKIEVEELTR